MVFGRDREERDDRDEREDEGGFFADVMRRAVERSLQGILGEGSDVSSRPNDPRGAESRAVDARATEPKSAEAKGSEAKSPDAEDRKKQFLAQLMPLLPRELVQTTLAAVDATKKEAVAMVGREVQQFLSSLNVAEELTKILTSVSFEIKTEVRFLPNEDGTLRPEVRASGKPKMQRARSHAPAKRPKRAATKPRSKGASKSSRGQVADAARQTVQAISDGTRDTVRRVVDKLAERGEQLATGGDDRS